MDKQSSAVKNYSNIVFVHLLSDGSIDNSMRYY